MDKIINWRYRIIKDRKNNMNLHDYKNSCRVWQKN